MKRRVLKIFLFSLPISASNLINILGNFLALIFLARVGIREVAAVSLSASLYYCLLTVVTTSSYAISILVSHAIGADKSQKFERIGRVFNAGIVGNLLLFIPAFFLMWHGESLLVWTGQDPELSRMTVPYFHYGAISLLPTLLAVVNAQFFIGIGMPNISLGLSLFRLCVSTFFAYGLILGKWGMPFLAVGGVSASIVIAQVSVCLISYLYLITGRNFKSYRLFQGFLHTDFRSLGQFFRIGLPIGIQFGGELLAIAVLTMMLGHMGVNALAATQIVSQFGLFLIMVMLGIAQAVSVSTSAAFGKKHYARVRQDLKDSMLLLSLIYLGFGLVVMLAYRPLLSLFFNVDAPDYRALLHLTLALMIIRGFILWIDGFRNLLSACLRGMQLSAYPMRVGLLCLWWGSLPAAYLGGYILKGGPIGLSIGFSSGFIVACFILWKKMQTLITSLN